MCDVEQKGEDIVSRYDYVEWSMFGKKGSTPQGKTMEFCKSCTTKIKDEIEKLTKTARETS